MEEVVNWILSGRCAVYPTSTLPALGCLPLSESLDELFELKSRDSIMPVSIGVSDLDQASEIVNIPNNLQSFLDFFPEGSLTIILESHKEMDSRLGGKEVAIRVLSHPIAKKLVSKTGPLIATSANLSGEIPVDDCNHASRILSNGGRRVLALDGVCAGGLPSTLIAWHTVCESPESFRIEVVREGKISSEDVFSWLKRVT